MRCTRKTVCREFDKLKQLAQLKKLKDILESRNKWVSKLNTEIQSLKEENQKLIKENVSLKGKVDWRTHDLEVSKREIEDLKNGIINELKNFFGEKQ